MTIARRPLLDLPMAASGGSSMPSSSSAPPASQQTSSAALPGADSLRIRAGVDPEPADPDYELSTTFDVPAFLRRQEG